MAYCHTSLGLYDVVINCHEDDYEAATQFVQEVKENIPQIEIGILKDIMDENRTY